MNNRMFSALLLLCLTLSGCAGIAAPTPSAVREVIVTSDEARVGPLLAHWEMGEETTIRVDEDALFSILGFQLTQSETLIFYSLVNLSAKTMMEEQLIGIHGGGGAFYSLIKVMPLLHDQNMEWASSFLNQDIQVIRIYIFK